MSNLYLSVADNNGLELKSDNETVTFNSGDPIVDWYSYILHLSQREQNDIVIYSSTIDNWLDDTEYFFIYFDENLKSLSNKELEEILPDDMVRLVSKKPMNTFSEIKEYCRKVK